MDMNRRHFFQVSGAGLVGSSLAALGFSPTEALAQTRNFKLSRTTETRSTCPYCSVSCGVIMYTMGDTAKNNKPALVHVEGDPDHPVNRGTLCPKGAGLADMINSPRRVKYPEVREPGSKADRDKNFIAKNDKGVTVNRWNTTGMLVSSASSNEAGYLTVKMLRSMGLVTLDTQARI
jgi:formate dehydrogenase major subunit